MNGINPHALYVRCDGAMSYDSKNTGGIGLSFEFPDFINLDNIQKSIGRYEDANIERLEINAILQGMSELLKLAEIHKDEFRKINTIIFITDRYMLNDKERTSSYRIREYRKNGWKNYEGKEIKNYDLLDRIDKTRKKITDKLRCSLEIKYERRKYNKVADKLANIGKEEIFVNKSITKYGRKIGRRKYEGEEILYKNLSKKDEIIIHIFRKEIINKQWEISTELCGGDLIGKKIKIYSDSVMERKLHRHSVYRAKVRDVFKHHITIYKTIKEVKNDKK